jgi:adenylate cyclase class 2
MLEHEAKILNINEEEVKARLETLGAQKVLDDVTHIEGYDFGSTTSFKVLDIPNRFTEIAQHINSLRGFSDMFSQGAYLRLRQEGNKFELIFKQKVKGDNGVKSEIEISVPIQEGEWEIVTQMLSGMGLKRIVFQEKKRTSYKYFPYRYDIDTWPGVPTYLEVEAPSPQGVLEAVALLGFSQENALSLSAAEVFEMYGIRDPRHLVFSERKVNTLNVVIAIIKDEQERLLFQLRKRNPYKNYLGLVGGKVEENESETAALSREVAEETGLLISQSQMLGTVVETLVTDKDSTEVSLNVYSVKAEGVLQANELEGEVIWVDVETFFREKQKYVPTDWLIVESFILKNTLLTQIVVNNLGERYEIKSTE